MSRRGARRISMVIVNHDYGRFLARSIDSALAQPRDLTEVVVVDDGSTDGSRAVIAGYGDAVVPVLKPNGGQASAFNAGFAASTGDVIVFIDADDFLLPDAAAIMAAAWPAGAAKLHWPLVKVDAEGRPTGSRIPDTPLIRGDYRDRLAARGPDHHVIPPSSPPTSGNAWPRWLLQKLLPMPEPPFRTAADNYLLNLAPLFGRIEALDEPLGCYRVHGANDSFKPLGAYAAQFASRHEVCRAAMRDIFADQGLVIAEDAWRRDTWFHQVAVAAPEFEAAVPEGARFLLAAEAEWQRGDLVPGRTRVPFLQQGGEYYGDPADDEAAIAALAHEQALGVTHFAAVWSKFWYWDHYPRFTAYLQQAHRQTLSSAYWRIFELGA